MQRLDHRSPPVYLQGETLLPIDEANQSIVEQSSDQSVQQEISQETIASQSEPSTEPSSEPTSSSSLVPTDNTGLMDEFLDGFLNLVAGAVGLPIPDESQKVEEQRAKHIRMQVASNLCLKEFHWDASLDSMKLSEVVAYEFCSLFERTRTLLPFSNKLEILFVRVFQTLSKRPFHKKNKQTLEHFLKYLRDHFVDPRHRNIIDQEIAPKISSLKFISTSRDFSPMSVGALRHFAAPPRGDEIAPETLLISSPPTSSSSSSQGPELDEHLFHTWRNFRCMMETILRMLNRQIQGVEQRFAAKEFIHTIRMIRRRGSASVSPSNNIFLNNWEETCNKILNLQRILKSRGRVVNDHYQTVLEALEMRLSGSSQTIHYRITQLSLNIKLFGNLIDQLSNLINKSCEGISLYIPLKAVNEIYDEIKKGQSFFLDDEEDSNDFKESNDSMGQSLLSLVKAQAKAITNTESFPDQPEAAKALVSASDSMFNLSKQMFNLAGKFQELNKSFENLSKEKKVTRKFLEKKAKSIQKQRRLQPHEIQLEDQFKKDFYRLMRSASEEVDFCQSALKPVIAQIESFSRQFAVLPTPSYSPQDVEDLWPIFSDKQEDQRTVSRMKRSSTPVTQVISSSQASSSTPEYLEEMSEIDLVVEGITESLTAQSTPPTLPETTLFLQHFNRLQFVPKLSDLTAGATLTSFQSQIIRSCFQDTAHHTTILGAAVDLIGRSLSMGDSSFQRYLPHIARVIARTTSTLSEQLLTGELFARNYPEATLEHSHVQLGRFLGKEIHHPLTTEDETFLRFVDYGVVAHRYPINLQTLRHQELPILRWIQAPLTLSLGDLQQTISATLGFLNRHGKISPENLSSLEMTLQQTLYPLDAVEAPVGESLKSQRLPALITGVSKLLGGIQHQLATHSGDIQKEIHDRWLNAEYHLKGLKESLECLQNFPHPEFLLLNGDMIIMHLQHLDELVEAIIHYQHQGERLNIHNLEIYRSLRGHITSPQETAIVAAFNSKKGDHYPHRYRVLLQSEQSERKLPLMTQWRLDAYAITPRLSDFAGGFTPIGAKKLKSPQQLCNTLLENSSGMIDLLSARITKLSYKRKPNRALD